MPKAIEVRRDKIGAREVLLYCTNRSLFNSQTLNSLNPRYSRAAL